MRILDVTSDKSIDNVALLLTKTEATQLMSYLESLTKEDLDWHYHLNNEDYSKEITIALYDESNLTIFSDRCKSLIIDDK